MARTQFSAQVFDKKNSRITLQVKRRIIRAYDALCKEAGIVGAATSFSDPNKLFKLSDYPNAQKKIEKLLEGLAGEIESIVTDGVDRAWNLSNQKNSAMVKSLAQQFGWSEDRVNELSRRNLSALQAFKARTDAGMDLSQRVWDFVRHDRQKLEWALGLGLAEGKSAAALSRDVRQYLNEPNKLFRRVRDKHGNLILSQAAKAYHPGQGVYRSSYKNALRLAVTETNMAYRTADHTAWSNMPFVTGIEVKLSAVHATSDIQGRKYPTHYFDMCDELAGVYPKEFKFTGWHPHCRCYVVTKLASRQEMDEYSQLTDEQQKNYHFKDEVREAPKAYNDWIQKNELRIANAKSTPYFIRENPHYTDAALHPEKYAVKPLVLQYNIVDQLEAFRTYGMMHQGSKKFNDALEDALKAQLSGDENAFYSAMATMGQVQKTNERVAKYLQKKKASKKNPEPVVDTNADIKKTPEEKHRIYESPLDEQFVEILQREYPHKIYVHVLKRPTEEDYARLLDAAKAYANTTDVCILPEIHKKEVGIRERLGITSDTKTPDLITGYGFVDVKSPKNSRNIWTNANSASDQGAIGCITNHRCVIKKSSIGNIGKNIIDGEFYDKSEVHFILDGTLYKCNGQGIILGQGSPASRVGFNGYISLRGAKIEIISQTDKRTISINALNKRKEQIMQYRVRKRKDQISKIAEERHANRTQDREQEIRDFWTKRKEDTKILRKEIADMQSFGYIKEASDPVDALNRVVSGTATSKSGNTIQTATMEKLRAASGDVKKVVDEFNSAMDEVRIAVNDLKGLEGVDVKSIINARSIETARVGAQQLRDFKQRFDYLDTLDVYDQRDLLEDYIKNGTYSFAKKALQKKLDVVKVDIKIVEITPGITDIVNLSQGSGVAIFKDTASKAQAALASRDVAQAESLMKKAEAMKDVAAQYDSLVALNYTTSRKFDKCLADGITLIENGDYAGAKDKFDEALVIMNTNLANVARRNARNARAAAAEEEARKKAEEAAAAKPKKKITDAESYDDLKEILGEDMPPILQHYEKSVARTKYTKKEYRDHEQEFHDKMKAMFDDSDFSHCFNYTELEGYLSGGLMNHHQTMNLGIYSKGKGYDENRYSYEHFAYGFQDNQNTVPDKDRLRWGDYYRCGVPVDKDKTKAYKQLSGYGPAQIVLRKNNVVTTFTFGNSLGEDTIPSLTCDPKTCSLDKNNMNHFNDSKYSNKTAHEGTHKGGYYNSRYIEIQYLPKKSTEYITVEDFESITLGQKPDTIKLGSGKKATKEFWEQWAKRGCSVYYYDDTEGVVKLYIEGKRGIPAKYNETAAERKKRQANAKARAEKRHAERDKNLKKKGLTPDDMFNQRIAEREEIKAKARDYAKNIIGSPKNVNADTQKMIDEVNALIDRGNMGLAKAKSIEIEAAVAKQNAELSKLKDLVPEYEKWHKQFTVEEIQAAHAEIKKKLEWIETSYQYRDDPDKVMKKLFTEADYAKDPRKYGKDKDPHKTWEIAHDAYMRKRDEAIYKYRGTSIDESIDRFKAFKTKDKDFKALLADIQSNAKDGKWGKVEELIVTAKEKMLEIQQRESTGHVIKLGECSQITFSKEDFAQARKDAAKWFRCDDKETRASIERAFKEADDYMTQYAQEMWKNLTDEEKHILWLYTDGSKYINDEMLGSYSLHMKSWIKHTTHNGLEDANVLTSIIEKAPALKDDIWMQSGKSVAAMEGIFGFDISRITTAKDLKKLVGQEGFSSVFMSCHSARNGYFTSGGSTGAGNPVVLSIYMPKGTKGAYMEPFASYGDDKRGEKGYEWTGEKRKEAPSNQVEFLLQRGCKFKITKAVYNKKEGKWYIDVDLIEQKAQTALDTYIPGLESRRVRFKPPTT